MQRSSALFLRSEEKQSLNWFEKSTDTICGWKNVRGEKGTGDGSGDYVQAYRGLEYKWTLQDGIVVQRSMAQVGHAAVPSRLRAK